VKILTINCGSSTVKCSLYSFFHPPISLTPPDWEATFDWKFNEQKSADKVYEKLKTLSSDKGISCIGHRIVHGGLVYKESVIVNSQVKKEIRKLSPLAPLHNLMGLKGIEKLEKLFPGKEQIAVFDTAFHHTLSEAAFTYPGPYRWKKSGIRRYGFHGISFQYCSKRASELLSKDPKKTVICHLGAGASLCAVENGKSIDTTMGFTPLEGLMMNTRSGTVDPGILLHLLQKKNKSLKALSNELYEKSGLLGLSGVSSDIRVLLKKAKKGHVRAKLALDVYIHRLCSMIGSMIASLRGIDTLVFTGGIGENSSFVREQVCNRLSFLGIGLQTETNLKGDSLLSSPNSKVQVLLIHTQEAFQIAKECWDKMSKG